MLSKILLLTLVASTFAAGSLITFNTRECEKMAASEGVALFGADTKMYTGMGVMFVNMDFAELKMELSSNSDFASCILEIEEDQIVQIDDPVAE